MSVAVSDAWAREMSAEGAEIEWMATVVQPAALSSVRHSWVTGSAAIVAASGERASPSLLRVVLSGSGVDVWDRSRSPLTVDLTVAAEAAQAVESALGLVGRTLQLRLGCRSLDPSLWIIRYTVRINDCTIAEDGTWIVSCGDAIDALFRANLTGSWVAAEPTTILDDLMTALPGDLVDTGLPAQLATRTHWSITRSRQYAQGYVATGAQYVQGVTGPLSAQAQPASALIGDLVTMLGGTLSLSPLLTYRHPVTSLTRTLAAEEVRRGPVVLGRDTVDTIRVDYAEQQGETIYGSQRQAMGLADSERKTPEPQRLTVRESNAGADVTGSAGSRDRSLSASWVTAVCDRVDRAVLADASAPGGYTTINSTNSASATQTQLVLLDATLAGFCGFRWRDDFHLGTASSATAVSGVVTFAAHLHGTLQPAHQVGDVIAYCAATPSPSGTIRYATITSTSSGTGAGPMLASTTEANHTISGPVIIWRAQHVDDRITADRPVYAHIEEEILQVTALRPCGLGVTAGVASRAVYDGATPLAGVRSYQSRVYPLAIVVDVTRGARGTSAAVHPLSALTYDATIPLAMADQRLGRHARGAPTTQIEAPMRHADLTEGDVIAFVDASVVSRYHTPASGASADVQWEVVSVAPDRDARCVRLGLAWLSQTTPSYTVTATYEGEYAPPYVDLGIPARGSVYYPDGTARRLTTLPTQVETDTLTVSIWVRPDATEAGQILIGRTSTSDRSWMVELTSSGQVRFYVASGASDTSNFVSSPGSGSGVLADGAWHHVCVRYEAGAVLIVLDGIVQTGATTTGTIATSLRASAQPISIGAAGDGGTQYDSGYLCHAVVWTKALAGAQIAGLISAGGQPAGPQMVDPAQRPAVWLPLADRRAAYGPDPTETGTGASLVYTTEYP